MSQNKTSFTELLINERAYVQYMDCNRYVRIDAALEGPYKKPASSNYIVGALICFFLTTYLLMGIK